MFVTQPGTNAVAWIPGTDSAAAKVKSGFDATDNAILAGIACLVFAMLGLLVASQSGRGSMSIALGAVSVAFAVVAAILARQGKNAKMLFAQMVKDHRALYTDSILYRLIAAQLLIKSARNIGDLLNDPDDAAVYEQIIADFFRHPDVVALIKAYDDALADNKRTHQMTAHAALVAKIDGVVEDLIGAYRMQHQ